MIGRDEPVLRRNGVEPAAEATLLDLDDAMAARADEVMVVQLGAEPVTELRAVMRQGVDHAFVGEEGERAVHGREPGELRSRSRRQSSCAVMSSRSRRARPHLEPLAGDSDVLAEEKRGEVCLVARLLTCVWCSRRWE